MSDEMATQLTEAVRYCYDPQSAGDQTLVKSDHGVLGGRVLAPGARTEATTLGGVDVFFMVRSGRARVLDGEGAVVAELDRLDGIVLPAGSTYAIEAPSDSTEALRTVEFHAGLDPMKASYLPFGE